MSMFAIITFRDEGPLKNMQSVAAANVHNARTKPLAHAMPNAPKPLHLVGSGNLVADVKAALLGVGIDPAKLRKNGVLAYEAILSASAAFFERGDEQERRERLDRWIAEQVKWALGRYGVLRVVSMVLHVDELVPHVHLVLLPLEAKPDARFADKDRIRWNLVGRTISGPGKFDEAHDAYAAAMAQFGLVRGIKGSGRKHEPVPVYVARMKQKEIELDGARAQHAAHVIEDERRLAAQRDEVQRMLDAAAQTVRDADAVSARINGHRSSLGRVFRAAAEFQHRLAAIEGKPLTPAVSSTLEALMALGNEARSVRAPSGEARPEVLGVYDQIRGRGASLGNFPHGGR